MCWSRQNQAGRGKVGRCAERCESTFHRGYIFLDNGCHESNCISLVKEVQFDVGLEEVLMRFLFLTFSNHSADITGSFGIEGFRDGADQGSIFGKIQNHVRPTNRLQQPPMTTNADGQACYNDEFGDDVTHADRNLLLAARGVNGNSC